MSIAHPRGEGRGGGDATTGLQLYPKVKLKKTHIFFLDTTVSKVLCYILFSLEVLGMEHFSLKRLSAEGLWGGLLYWGPWNIC
jgi:hypothetical protein